MSRSLLYALSLSALAVLTACDRSGATSPPRAQPRREREHPDVHAHRRGLRRCGASSHPERWRICERVWQRERQRECNSERR